MAPACRWIGITISGYQGDYCETETNPCTCVNSTVCVKEDVEYSCICPQGEPYVNDECKGKHVLRIGLPCEIHNTTADYR